MTDDPTGRVLRRRSVLFMPASNPRAMAKARDLACDAVILDLEDAVAPEAKDAARAAALAAAAEGFGGRACAVRINGLDTPWGANDAAALAAAPGVAAVVVPKVGSAADLAAVRAALGADGPPIWAMIETPRAIFDIEKIASAADDSAARLEALVLGPNDIAKSIRLSAISLALGRIVYDRSCASCHGAKGEGGKGFQKPLAGTRTVSELSQFISKTIYLHA